MSLPQVASRTMDVQDEFSCLLAEQEGGAVTRNETLRRFAVFTAGMLACAVGIAFITRAGLGTSPISSMPFVLSLITPVSMGIYTLSFNLLFLLCESLLTGRFTKTQALQIPVTVLFSLSVDGALHLIPSRYGGPWTGSAVYLVIGCAVMSFGIYLEVLADIIMLPGEAFVRALSKRTGRGFGNVKVCFDSCLTAIAAAAALVAFGRLNGVGGGTVFSALAVGQMVKGWGRLYRHIREHDLQPKGRK